MTAGKTVFFLICASMGLLLFSGCSESDPVKEYGQALLDSYDRSKAVAGAASLEAIQTAVNAFEATNGRYPGSLDEIKDDFAGRIDWEAFRYDPRTGKVSLAR